MQQKYIAIGVAVVVAVAAIGGGLALVAKSNGDNNNNYELPDISGKWNIAYVEFAKLSNDDETPIYDPNEVSITDHHLNPYEPEAYINVTQVGDHGFIGKFIRGENDSDIAGSRDGSIIKFALERDGHLHLFELSAKKGYLSGAMTVVNHGGGSATPVVCGIAYILFIPDGGKPVPIRSDYFNMSIMKIAEPVKAVLHQVGDFSGEKTGRGTDIDVTTKYVRSHTMISIHSNEKEGATTGVQAVVSMGVTPRGSVGGVLAGNMKSPIDGVKNWMITGNMMIAHGKATFLSYHNPDVTDSYPSFVEVEYNVPYNKGGDLSPVYISEEHEYKGTLTFKTLDGKPTEKEITLNFKVFDNTIYSEVTSDGKAYIWFGEIYGHAIVLHVMDKDLGKAGRISGHVDRDGEIHLFGVMIDSTTKKPSVFIEISLKLVK